MLNTIVQALTRPRRAPVPPQGPTTRTTLHFSLSRPCTEALAYYAAYRSVRAALAPALAREAAAHLAGLAVGEEKQP